jgi:raffinose/stachyose/melibiose transport system permease protein
MTPKGERWLSHVVLLAFSIVAIYPIANVVLLALNAPGTPVTGFGVPAPASLDSFSTAWTVGGFSRALVSSLIVSIVVVVAVVILSTLTGYALGTMRFPGSNAIFLLFVVGIVLPYEGMVVPLYYDFRSLGLTNNYLGLILPQVGLSLGFGTFWMRGFFRSAPRSMIEAGQMDGASSWVVLTRVLVPLARPALLTLALLVFLWTWNEFLLALVMIQDDTIRTAPLVLAFFSGGLHGADYPIVAAAATVVAIPVVAVYVLLQRHYVAGFLAGALQGE